MNPATVLVGLATAAVLAVAVYGTVRSFRRGGCDGCHGCCGSRPALVTIDDPEDRDK